MASPDPQDESGQPGEFPGDRRQPGSVLASVQRGDHGCRPNLAGCLPPRLRRNLGAEVEGGDPGPARRRGECQQPEFVVDPGWGTHQNGRPRGATPGRLVGGRQPPHHDAADEVLPRHRQVTLRPRVPESRQGGHQPLVHHVLEGAAGELLVQDPRHGVAVEVCRGPDQLVLPRGRSHPGGIGPPGGLLGCFPCRPAGLDQLVHRPDPGERRVVIEAVARRRAGGLDEAVAALPGTQGVLGNTGEFRSLLDRNHDGRRLPARTGPDQGTYAVLCKVCARTCRRLFMHDRLVSKVRGRRVRCRIGFARSSSPPVRCS